MTSPLPGDGGDATSTAPPADPFDDPAFDAAAYVNALFPNGEGGEREWSMGERKNRSLQRGALAATPCV